MAEQDLLNAFNDCIDRIKTGQTIEDCLRRYPQYAAALRPMLETGNVVRSLHVSPVEVAQVRERARYRFEEAIRTTRRGRKTKPVYRLGGLAAAILLMILVISGGASVAAQFSLPGDSLYGLKLLTEQIRLSVSNDPALVGQFEQRRIDETRQLLNQDRPAEVAFQGTLMAISSPSWTVAGIPVQVSGNTSGATNAAVGDIVEIQGWTTSQGQLFATAITIISTTAPQPSPTFAPTHVPTVIVVTQHPTLTPTPSATQTPLLTATSAATTTATATATVTLSPTITPVPTLTATLSPTVCVPAPPIGWVVYQVQPGDTLTRLASASNISLTLLMSANCLVDPGFIVVGDHLYLPNAVSPISTTPPTGDNNNINQNDNNNGGQDNNPGNNQNGNNDNGDDHGGGNGGHGGDG